MMTTPPRPPPPDLPLLLITAAVALGIVAVFVRYAVTGEFSPTVAGALGALLTALYTALKERRKKGGDDDENSTG